jgi:hypothetical protein
MSEMTFYRLSSLTMTPCQMTRGCFAHAEQSWLCPQCRAVRQGYPAIDVTLVGAPDDTPLNFPQGTALGIMQRKFLSLLGDDDVQRDLYVGQIERADGAKEEGWVTFHGHHRIIVRGTKHVNYRRREQCGQPSYFAMGSRYLCPEPQKNVGIFDDGCGAIVVVKYIYDRIAPKRWKKLLVEKLPVLTNPMDSLPTSL